MYVLQRRNSRRSILRLLLLLLLIQNIDKRRCRAHENSVRSVSSEHMIRILCVLFLHSVTMAISFALSSKKIHELKPRRNLKCIYKWYDDTWDCVYAYICSMSMPMCSWKVVYIEDTNVAYNFFFVRVEPEPCSSSSCHFTFSIQYFFLLLLSFRFDFVECVSLRKLMSLLR